jgi:hypothetical protein
MSWWQYLLLVNVYLVLFYGFYVALLRNETFFQLNRVYLVCASALSFIIPLIQSGWVQKLFITREVSYSIYGGPVIITQFAPVQNVPVNIGQILACVYFVVVLFLMGRLAWQLVSLNKIIKSDQQDVAYSFFKKIKLPKEAAANNIISAHEEIHAQQWHSADVFIIEAVMIINWFNPVVYFYRRAIKHIHEFIADDHALKVAANKADYAMLLLTQTFNSPSHNLINTFINHSLLKQRIIMLQKNKSQRIKLLKYGLSAPLFMLMLVLSSATVNNSKVIKAINLHLEQVTLMPVNGKTISNSADLPNSQHPYATAVVADTTKTKPIVLTDVKLVQPDTTPKNAQPIFAAVEKEPEFPGGWEKFTQFLADNIKTPQDMITNNVSGKVIATFVVEADGSLSGIKILNSPALSATDEATRVLNLSPKWHPGYQNNKPVRVQFTVPIVFNTGVNVIGYGSKTDTGKHIYAIRINGYNNPNVTYIVDGKQTSTADAKLIDATTIERVNVIKDPNNPDGKGVVEITTKKQNTIALTMTPPPLYIVDGKEKDASVLQNLDPNTIESMTVLNGKNADLQYGSKGKNGVIIIKLKVAATPQAQPTGK